MAGKQRQKAPEPKGPEIIDVEQGSDEWFAARLGLPTASVFGIIMSEEKETGEGGRTKLLYKLAGEIITGMPAEGGYTSRAMERGKEMEPQAIEDYVERTGAEIRRVGLVKNFDGVRRCGCSPDALVGFDGGLETKTMRPDLLIPLILKGAATYSGHRAQVQGSLWVTGREWWDLKIFYPGMPNFTQRFYRDEVYLKQLDEQIQRFNWELEQLVKRLRAMGAG